MSSETAPLPAKPLASRGRSVAFMLVASLSFAVMGTLVKVASVNASFLTTVFVRSLVVWLVVATVCRVRRLPLFASNRRLMWWRTFVGFSAMCLYFYAIGRLHVANAITIQYTSPLFVALLSGSVLGERVQSKTHVLLWVAFLGCALILGPDLGDFNPGALAALGSAVLAALAYLAVRGLGTTEAPETIVAEFAFLSTLASSPGLVWISSLVHPGEITAMLGVGLTASLGQVGMTYAYRYADAAFVSAFSYSTVLFGAVIGVVWLGEVPTWMTGVGVVMVVGAGTALSLRAAPR